MSEAALQRRNNELGDASIVRALHDFHALREYQPGQVQLHCLPPGASPWGHRPTGVRPYYRVYRRPHPHAKPGNLRAEKAAGISSYFE
jgi:hypothetical protein